MELTFFLGPMLIMESSKKEFLQQGTSIYTQQEVAIQMTSASSDYDLKKINMTSASSDYDLKKTFIMCRNADKPTQMPILLKFWNRIGMKHIDEMHNDIIDFK